MVATRNATAHRGTAIPALFAATGEFSRHRKNLAGCPIPSEIGGKADIPFQCASIPSLGGTCDHALTSCREPKLAAEVVTPLAGSILTGQQTSPQRTNRSASRQNSGALPYTVQAIGCSLHEQTASGSCRFPQNQRQPCARGGQAALTQSTSVSGGRILHCRRRDVNLGTWCKRSCRTSPETSCHVPLHLRDRAKHRLHLEFASTIIVPFGSGP